MRRLLLTTLLLALPIAVIVWYRPIEVDSLPAAAAMALAVCGLRDVLGAGAVARVAATGLGSAFFVVNVAQACAFVLTAKAIDFEFWFHVNVDALTFATTFQRFQMAGAALWTVASIAALAFVLRPSKEPLAKGERTTGLVALVLAVGILVFTPSPLKTSVAFARRVARANQVERMDPRGAPAWGVKLSSVDETNLRVAGGGRNLVLIYLESLESTFLDEASFPGVLPNLEALRGEAVVFDDVSPALNAHFTIGGVYASLTGSHLIEGQLRKALDQGMNVEVGSALLSVPRILHQAGYRQTFMVGHAPDFSGLNVLLTHEGYDRIWSSARSDGAGGWVHTGDPWGCFDRELFEHAFDEYSALSSSGAPFNLTVLTIDTHWPVGRIEDTGEPLFGSGTEDQKKLLTALHRTDRALGQFIARLKQTAAWPNTTVFVMSDHLARSCSLSPQLERHPNRRMNVFALNAGPPRHVATEGRTFDVAPTLLDLLGIKTNYVFPLGESLLGAPGANRLKETSARQEEYLKLYVLLQRSDYRARAGTAVTFASAPYPSMQIGDMRVPLTDNQSGIQTFPTGSEACGVRIDRSGKLLGYERTSSADDLKRYVDRDDSLDARVVVLGGPASGLPATVGKTATAGSYSLLYKWRARYALREAPRPEDLSLTAEEIAEVDSERQGARPAAPN